MKKKFLVSILCLTLFVCGGVCLNINAMPTIEKEMNFIDKSNIQLEYGKGAIPVMPTVEEMTKSEQNLSFATGTSQQLPTRYNVAENYLINVGNQNNHGVCWVFGSNTATENFIARNFGDYINFSEAWVAVANRTLANDYVIGDGGHHGFYIDSVNMHGVVLEEDMPYELLDGIGESNWEDYYSVYSSYAKKDLISYINYVQCYNISHSTATWQMLKEYIYNYSAITGCIDANSTSFLTNKYVSTSSEYYNSKYVCNLSSQYPSGQSGINHMITLIGYDDNYVCQDKQGGVHVGAWIAQNSWGGSYDYFYIAYDDHSINYQIAYIDAITYNGYQFDFSKSSEENYAAYIEQNLYLLESNSNYSNMLLSESFYDTNVAKNLFNYTEQADFYNTLTYTYPFDNKAFLDVEIRQGLVDVTDKFLITKNYEEKILTIKSLETGLNAGNYTITINVDKNIDGEVDQTYTKCFYVYSGAEIEMTASYDVYDYSYFGNYATYETNSNKISAFYSIYDNNTARLNTSIYLPHYSKIKSYTLNCDRSVYTLYHSQPTYATDSKFATGHLTLQLVHKTSFATEPFDIVLTFHTTDNYSFDYTITCMPFNVSSVGAVEYCVDPVVVNYHLDGGTIKNQKRFFDSAVVNDDISSYLSYKKVYLETPTKKGYKFNGWYQVWAGYELECQKDSIGYFLEYSDTMNGGKCYSGSMTNHNSLNILAKFVEEEDQLKNFHDNSVVEDIKFIHNEQAEVSNITIQTVNGQKVQKFDITQSSGYSISHFIINNNVYTFDNNNIKFYNTQPVASSPSNSITTSYYYTGTDLIHSFAAVTEKSVYQINIDHCTGGSAKIGLTQDAINQTSVQVECGSDTVAYISAIAEDNYEFFGWEITAGSEYITINDVSGNPTSINTLMYGSLDVLDATTIVITPVFHKLIYSISYLNTDGATPVSILPQEYQCDVDYVSIPNMHKSGYSFAGWTYGGQTSPVRNLNLKIGIWDGEVIGDLTLTANWVAESVFVNYLSNEGEGEIPTVQVYTTGGSFTTAGIGQTGVDGIYKKYYDLQKWQFVSVVIDDTLIAIPQGNSGVYFDLNTTFTLSNIDSLVYGFTGQHFGADDEINLQAVWGEPYTYEIVFITNTYQTSLPVTYKDGITEADLTMLVNAEENINAFGKDDIFKTAYEIIGWEIGETGKNILPTISPVKYLIDTMEYSYQDNQTIYLYAIWAPTQYTITFDFNDQTFTTITYDVEDNRVRLPAVNDIPAGHYFVWKSSGNASSFWNKSFPTGDNEFTFADLAYGNVILTGVFEPNLYNISYLKGDASVIDAVGFAALQLEGIAYSEEIYNLASISVMSEILEKTYFEVCGFSINGTQLTGNETIRELAELAQVVNKHNADIEIEVLWQGIELDIEYYIKNIKLNETQYAQITDVSTLSTLVNKHRYNTVTMLNMLQVAQGETFSGWHPENENVVFVIGRTDFTSTIKLYGEITITQYTVSFYNDADVPKKYDTEIKVGYGSQYDIGAFIPQKESSISEVFTFSHWADVDGNEITDFTIYGDTSYYAVFSSTPREYIVKFYDYQGVEVLDEQSIVYENLVAYLGQTPQKPATNSLIFEFVGWTPKLNDNAENIIDLTHYQIIGDTEFYPFFQSLPRMYTLEFIDSDADAENLNIFETRNLQYDATIDLTDPNYEPSVTSKNNAQYSYTFIGWFDLLDLPTDLDGEIDLDAEVDVGKMLTTITIQENRVVYAWFKRELNSYSLSFTYRDCDTLLAVEFVDPQENPITQSATYGSVLKISDTYPENPAYQNPDLTKIYTFLGWSSSLTEFIEVTEITLLKDTVVYAFYESELIKIKYVFYDETGESTVLTEIEEYYGQPEINMLLSNDGIYIEKFRISKPATDKETFAFYGWYLTPITERAPNDEKITSLDFTPSGEIQTIIKLYAGFTSTLNEYTFNFDGFPNITSTLTFGQTINIDETIATIPTKRENVRYNYTFNGWYTKDGTNTNDWGEKITEITLNENTFELFASCDFKLYQRFDAHLQSYTIKYVNYDNNLLMSIPAEYGTNVDYGSNEPPVKEGTSTFYYVFTGWRQEGLSDPVLIGLNESISVEPTKLLDPKEIIFKANYEERVVPYTLTLMLDDGTIFYQEEFRYDDLINLEQGGFNPQEKPAANGYKYVFVGWSKNPADTAADGKFEKIFNITNNVTLYAIYKEVAHLQLDQGLIEIILYAVGGLAGLAIVIVIISTLIKRARNRSGNNATKTTKQIEDLRAQQEKLKREREEIERRIRERLNKK